MTKTIVIVSTLFTLASRAYPATVSTFSISTGAQGATPCSLSGSGPGSFSCRSSGHETGDPNTPTDAAANVTLTDNSINLSVGSFNPSEAQAFASITHDDFFSVPVNGPVSALVSLTCTSFSHFAAFADFSLGSTTVSPPVESIFKGASQGSGECDIKSQIANLPAAFAVSLVAMNNIVHLHTYIDGKGQVADNDGGVFVQLTVNGFQDANGNPITATLIATPEPGTLGTLALALLIGAAVRLRLSSG